MANENGAIGWDDEVSEANANGGTQEREEFVVLPAGDYAFTVNKVERGQHPGSANLPPCNMVKVGVIVDGLDKGRSYLTMRFYMHTKMLWKIYQFMTSIGLHKKGDGATVIPWNKVAKGMVGACRVTQRTYNGKLQNDISEWIEPSGKPDDEEW